MITITLTEEERSFLKIVLLDTWDFLDSEQEDEEEPEPAKIVCEAILRKITLAGEET